MNFTVFILLLSYLLFLYFLYYLSRDDFLIIRKNILLEKIFSMAILTGIVSLLFSRLLFAVFNARFDFFNPLVFLAFPYFPGFSLIGGVTGAAIFIYIYTVFKKIPAAGRLFDLFTISFIGVMPVGYLLTIFIMQQKNPLINFVIFIFSVIIFFFFVKVIFPFSSRGEIKDGTLGLIYILALSFIYFISKLFIDIKNFSFINPENIFLLIVFFTTLVLIINQEIMNKYLIKK